MRATFRYIEDCEDNCGGVRYLYFEGLDYAVETLLSLFPGDACVVLSDGRVEPFAELQRRGYKGKYENLQDGQDVSEFWRE